MSMRPSGSFRPSAACSRSASQAPPVWMPIIALRGPIAGLSLRASSSQSASASGSFIEVLLEQELRGYRVDVPAVRAAQARLGLHRRETLIYPGHGKLEAPLETAGEILGLPRHGVRLARHR